MFLSLNHICPNKSHNQLKRDLNSSHGRTIIPENELLLNFITITYIIQFEIVNT